MQQRNNKKALHPQSFIYFLKIIKIPGIVVL